MGAEKGGKRSGFFHLFDWNRKSRKKLFANESSHTSPDGVKQVRQLQDQLPSTRFRLTDDEDIIGVSSVKGTSDHSCASSVTDEGANGVRAPGVVARLMGLDPLPTNCVFEPHSTPLFDPRSFRDNRNQKRSPEYYMNDRFSHAQHFGDNGYRKAKELRSQMMPSSPIERFQRETMPSSLRQPRSLPITHHKLLSPIKNPGFISAENAADIMEAAAKIFEPNLQLGRVRAKAPPFASTSVPQRTSKPTESSKTVSPESNAIKSLRGQPLSRSWNGSEDSNFPRPSLDSDTRSKGKSISLAIQAKENVQRRESLCTSGRSMLVGTEHAECKTDHPPKSLHYNQKNRQQQKLSAATSSCVLRQNNQKQNCQTSRERLGSKPSITSQRGRKGLPEDTSSRKTKNTNKLSGNSRNGPRKEGIDSNRLERGAMSSNSKNFSRKKRVIDGGFPSVQNCLSDDILAGIHGKHLKPHVLIDEQHSTWKQDDGSNGADVVSFTFTSPMLKPMPGSQSSTHLVEEEDNRKETHGDAYCEKNTIDANYKHSLPLGSDVMNNGDALSVLLEKKLKELTTGAQAYCSHSTEPRKEYLASAFEESLSFDTSISTPEECKGFLFRSCEGRLDDISDSNLSLTKLGMRHNLEEAKALPSNDGSSTDVHDLKKFEHSHRSPLSVLEASFSNETCISSEIRRRTDGSNKSSSSVQAQNVTGSACTSKPSKEETDAELTDSASSAIPAETISTAHASEISKKDLVYLKEILGNKNSAFKSPRLYETLDPLLFEKLARKGEDKDCKLRRKVLFDCVNECLDMKYSKYFCAGYRTWAKGSAVIGKELAEELYKEISGWKSMGDWMVDEIVERDMSSHLGCWTNFEIEAFEEGMRIERDILSSLVDELVAELII